MCEGPHLAHTGEVPKGCFKLDRISGSYWRGDEKNPMLSRIYGLAFESKDELEDYIERRKLAMERDHRKLGEELDLFFMDEEVGVGLPMWMPNGAVVRDELGGLGAEVEFRRATSASPPPRSPAKSSTTARAICRTTRLHVPRDGTVDEHDEYYLRPMNCPHHHKIYGARPAFLPRPAAAPRGIRQHLPLREARLAGGPAARARHVHERRAHLLHPGAGGAGVPRVISMYRHYYGHLRMGNFRVRLSLHDPNSDKFVDRHEEWWNRCEDIVRDVLKNLGVDYRGGARRGRLLRPEDRHPGEEPARPRGDRVHLPARLRRGRAL
jgi:threonyl-tRNA synthetase